jgi:hypothetical protein
MLSEIVRGRIFFFSEIVRGRLKIFFSRYRKVQIKFFFSEIVRGRLKIFFLEIVRGRLKIKILTSPIYLGVMSPVSNTKTVYLSTLLLRGFNTSRVPNSVLVFNVIVIVGVDTGNTKGLPPGLIFSMSLSAGTSDSILPGAMNAGFDIPSIESQGTSVVAETKK